MQEAGRVFGCVLWVYFVSVRTKGILYGKAEEGCVVRRGLIRGRE
jgi:hypothetical protein